MTLPRTPAPLPEPQRQRPTGWRAGALLRETLLRLHHAWEVLPARARRVWWAGMGAGFAGLLALTLLLVRVARSAEARGLLRREGELLRWMESASPLSFNAALWLEGVANGFVLWAVVLFAAGVAAWHGRALRAVTLLTGYTLMYGSILTGWLAWDRARPRLIAEGLATPGGPFRSYPSGHTMQAVVAYGLLFAFWWSATQSRGERAAAAALLLLLILVTAVSRLRLGAHWPSDVAAGLVLGAAWLAALLATLRAAERQAGDTPAGARHV